jgi:hypothetical protein
MLNGESARRVARLQRRARAIAGLEAAARATLVGGFSAGSLLLLTRLLGRPLAPAVAWGALAAVAVAAVAWGLLQMRRGAPSRGACAAWLDRRLSLGGLLLTSAEVDAAAWQPALSSALAGAGDAQPPLPVRRAAARIVPPLAFLAAVALLPGAEPAPPSGNPAIADALAVEQSRLDLLEERHALDPEAARELQTRLDELVQRLDRNEPVSWSDVDALSARGDAALALSVDALREALDALTGAQAAGSDQLAGQLGQTLEALRDAGLLGELPPELLAQLGVGDGAQGDGQDGRPQIDPSALARLDARSLEQLAGQLQSALGQRLDALVQAGLADPEQGRRLAEWSEREREAGEGHCHGPQCAGGHCPGGAAGMLAGAPGNGGISRGRADAPLHYAGDTAEADQAFRSEQLPSTAPLSTDWTTTGTGLAEPQVEPVESQAAGGAAQAGPGAAAWQRRLAPHHRDVVKRFFERKP